MQAFVPSKDIYGRNLSWRTNISAINIYLNAQNSYGISNSDVKNAVLGASTTWGQYLPMSLQVYETTSAPSTGRNDIYFSNNSMFFSDSSIVAVTQVSYKEGTGEILEADIVINNNATTPSLETSELYYLGNTVVHEFGHFIGLGHSQFLHSTMFYKLNYGQYQMSEEDISSVRNIYSSGVYPGIRGTVVGGRNLSGIFGANIQAISMKYGKVVGSAISETDGTFVIDGLDSSDNYFLYVKPSYKPESLPYYYRSMRSDFCEGRTKYRGNLYSTCFADEQGMAQIVSLNDNNNLDVGMVSIGCGLEVSPNYLQDKNTSAGFEPDLIRPDGTIGMAMTGYFSLFDITSNVPDKITFDLTNYSLPSGQIYLEIKALYHSIYSPLKLDFSLSRNGASTVTFPSLVGGVGKGSDNSINFDASGRILLDSGNSSNNSVTLTITPDSMSDYLLANPSISYSLEDIYPSSTQFMDDHGVYILIASISEYYGGSFRPIRTISNTKIYDNKRCPQGPNAFAVMAANSNALSSSSNNKKLKDDEASLIAACGTIGPIGPDAGASSGVGFFMTFLLGFLFLNWLRSSRRIIF
ncbi:MAG: matrixin family metalloprotease [Bdellovibrio sp.]|nr:matrixin family metalloprotease [Bdellovibrio sp.]